MTTVEVGGAYGHLFYPLIDFLELKTLIVTDLDAVRQGEKNKWRKCACSQGVRSSNAAINRWFQSDTTQFPTIDELVAKSEADKVKGCRRIAYQIPEQGSSFRSRSFEDALILANPSKFELPSEGDLGDAAWEIAQDLGKADTAFEYAVSEDEWVVPFYIREGLLWLSSPPAAPEQSPDDVVDLIAAILDPAEPA